LGFSLELEGQSGAPASADALPFPGARVASEGLAESAAATDHLPALQPVVGRGPARGGALRPAAKKRSLGKIAVFAAGGVVGLAGIGAALYFTVLAPTAPKFETVIAPSAANLLKDTPAAYAAVETQMAQVLTPLKEEGDLLRARTAEVSLVGVLVHGLDPAKISRAEQMIQAIKATDKPAPATLRAKALLAIAKGTPKNAESILASQAAAPESLLVVGLARLANDNAAGALEPLRQYAAAHPQEVVAEYARARALGQAGKPEAKAAYEKVVGRNPQHFGAALGLARLEEPAEKRMAAAQALIDRKQAAASPQEISRAHLLLAEAGLELGRRHEVEAALRKAISLDSKLTEASLALGELLLYDARFDEALTVLQAAGPTLEASTAGKFALGGAYLATKKTEQATKLLTQASKTSPTDPRGAFWNGFAAANRQPPDLVDAEQNYREALKRNPKFLPASLRLAALLQQQNKAQESLTVLRAAEEAGAPAAILQLAWGDALIVAKEPVKAEEVFRKALEGDAKSAPARLGVAAALQAQNKLKETKAYLEETLKDLPTTAGVRERLAEVCLALGEKDEALARYQDELKTGRVTTSLRLALSRLALDLGKMELALSEAKKVQDENPRNAEAAYLLARVHETRGESGAALAEYRRALQFDKLPIYNLAFARVLMKVGKEQEANAALDAASSLPEARMERGRALLRRGDVPKALADFVEASKMMPDAVDPLILQGLCYDKMGQQPKAESAWQAAIRIDPEASEPHYRLGRREMDQGRPKTAIEHFHKAIAKIPANSPWESEIYFQLGQAELLMGSKPAALAAFKKYAELAPTDAPSRPEAEKQIKRLSLK
jgi:tetratricopeptide (TPR) repeat protein